MFITYWIHEKNNIRYIGVVHLALVCSRFLFALCIQMPVLPSAFTTYCSRIAVKKILKSTHTHSQNSWIQSMKADEKSCTPNNVFIFIYRWSVAKKNTFFSYVFPFRFMCRKFNEYKKKWHKRNKKLNKWKRKHKTFFFFWVNRFPFHFSQKYFFPYFLCICVFIEKPVFNVMPSPFICHYNWPVWHDYLLFCISNNSHKFCFLVNKFYKMNGFIEILPVIAAAFTYM